MCFQLIFVWWRTATYTARRRECLYDGSFSYEVFKATIRMHIVVTSNEPSKAQLTWARLDEWPLFKHDVSDATMVMVPLYSGDDESATRPLATHHGPAAHRGRGASTPPGPHGVRSLRAGCNRSLRAH